VFFTCGTSPTAAVAAVARSTNSDSPEERLAAAVEALLAGPTAAEQGMGLRSWFSSETAGSLNDVTIDGAGSAIVDLSDLSTIISKASTTAGRQQLLAELRATVFQFDEVRELQLQFDGSCSAFWGWLEATCTPMEAEGS